MRGPPAGRHGGPAVGGQGLTHAGLDVPEPLPALLEAHRSLKQVLINLLGKAAKFTPEGRRIRVAASMAGGSLEIVIRDTVIGILGSTTMPGHPPSSGVNIDATPPRAAIRNAGETIRSMRDQRR